MRWATKFTVRSRSHNRRVLQVQTKDEPGHAGWAKPEKLGVRGPPFDSIEMTAVKGLERSTAIRIDAGIDHGHLRNQLTTC